MFDVWKDRQESDPDAPKVVLAIDLSELFTYFAENPVLTSDVQIIDLYGETKESEGGYVFKASKPMFVFLENGRVAVSDSQGLDSYVRRSRQVLVSEEI